MKSPLGPTSTLGYCTNVHPGANLAQLKANLDRFAVPIKQSVSPDAPMGVGLWFPAAAAQEVLAAPNGPADLKAWLAHRGLLVYTLNGFPHGNFHQPVVKDAVYLPHWAQRDRLNHTRDLITLLAALLPDGAEGSISTLPLAWPAHVGGSLTADPDFAPAAAANLTQLVHELARIELTTGHHIHLDLEPEPGCLIHNSTTLVDFFEDHLLGTADQVSVLGYLRVCHDVCHAAVMFEDQQTALNNYRSAGIKVGKVQLSSALHIPFGTMNHDERTAARNQLALFAEPRYLHQTSIRKSDGTLETFNDLPAALDAHPQPDHEWRVHFHVPVHQKNMGAQGVLSTTQSDIPQLLKALAPEDETHHFEVETYAWNVLPHDSSNDDHNTAENDNTLIQGIANELTWVRDEAMSS
ncbi:MAG: metabolite traffic protein EboE [Algisphaera sp.]